MRLISFCNTPRLLLIVGLTAVFLIPAGAQDPLESDEAEMESAETFALTPNSFSAGDVAAAQQFTQTLGIAEWLGPMAPVALSPFFGIACLSGMSLYGQNWIAADNAFLGEASPLHNPVVFWVFLGLTVLTSVPRFTKVSKPFAQAMDHVEAWSGIITMVVLKIMIGAAAPAPEQLDVVQMGLLSSSVDTLLIIAAAINIFVINALKFFFEMLIWITPVPAIDAIFEVANKTACGLLMAIYGYSPTIATIINLLMFVVAAIVFRWVYRREVFFRTILMDALVTFFFPPTSVSKPDVWVFPTRDVGPIPARARCLLRRSDTGWSLIQQRMFRQNITVDIGFGSIWIRVRRFQLTGNPSGQLTFSRRFNQCLPELAAALGASHEEQHAGTAKNADGLKAEMA